MAPYPGGLSVSVEIGGREVATTEIKVRDIYVVGIGDSFGSGEGNPDVPVRFSPERTIQYGKSSDTEDLSGYPARVGPWKQVGDAAFVEENARWLDQACHRSLYSYQLRAALELAIEDPHRAVTYTGFACSGAEVTWGLFLRYKGNEWVPHPPDLSQISATADAQCGKANAPPVDMPEAYHMNGVIPELQGGVVLDKCPPEKARKIDLLMMSIGGNDIGFARLVANAVLADDSLVRNLGGWFGQVHGNRESQDLLTRLDERYKAMNRALHGILNIPWGESDRIILTAYPPFALLDDAGAMCPDGTAGMEVFNEFAITQKAALSSAWLADKLDQVMEKSARSFGWSFVWDHRKAFVGRGLCAGHTDGLGPLADDLRLPRRHDGVWSPYNPINYQPYAARQRWFRTPNDAFMTANFHVAGSVMQKVLKLQSFSWFQVLLASTYSGAFHPTAEGHAAIADAVVARARAVLAEHGQQSAAALKDLP
jgi:lysophospholipase L1-like esterase